MKKLKLIAVDLDGPLLVDTFSPILKGICDQHGTVYDRDIEYNSFSRNRQEVVLYFRERFSDNEEQQAKTDEEMIQDYFDIRNEFMKTNPTGLKASTPGFVEMLESLNVPLICYGGLSEAYYTEEMGEYANAFETYVCTNDFRPGIKEIHHKYSLEYGEALFIDDVAFVAEHAKALNVPFIGVPSTEPWSWQRKDMEAMGVAHLVDSAADITTDMIREIDQAASEGRVWPENVML